MQLSRHFENYLAAELESERCKSISLFSEETDTDTSANTYWTLLSLLPSRLERVQVASSLKLNSVPHGVWPVCTLLLKDSEQDVVGNAINSMTRSKVRSFAHRAFHYFKSPERPQRILYCLARYCEEANDRRIAEQLAPTLASDLSDAYLARSFNALYKHGIKSSAALRVAMELVESHIDATNMDRKAAVAAITYLFFAGSVQEIEKIRIIHDRVTIPELRRLLNWGLQEISQLTQSTDLNLSEASAEKFWIRNLLGTSPNYTGFGCFSSKDLVAGLNELDTKGKLPELNTLTERLLSLGDFQCTDWLAAHKSFGIDSIAKAHPETVKLWKNHATQNAPSFLKTVMAPENASIWHTESPELVALNFIPESFQKPGDICKKWITAGRKQGAKVSLNILLGLILAIENSVLNAGHSETLYEKELNEICLELKTIRSQMTSETADFDSCLLGALIGSPLTNKNIATLVINSISSIGWWDLAIPFLQFDTAQHLQSLLTRFDSLAKNSGNHSLNEKQVLTLARSASLAILNSREKQNEKNIINSFQRFVDLTQILDPNNNVAALSPDADQDSVDLEDAEQNTADWSGHFIVDRPLARWGTIIEVLHGMIWPSESNKDDRDQQNTKLLSEALRTANHVEKRWIARALAQLGTDDAVKTLLYQGLQHIDSEFIAHTIRELLPSAHPRAQQALIRCVGRNAISDDLKLSIIDEMNISNPNEILQELRTLEILRLPQHIDDAIRDAVGRVAALIDEKESLKANDGQEKVIRLDGQDVDSVIRSILPNHDLLNVDSRSALRTAEMILVQSKGWTQGGMDLSPIVNMHCKAVELVLRDSFEPFTDAILRRGQLSRKLDILGYARPIPEKMQIFEDTLAGLPVVKTIPYFSKFKLRKMLRGICLFRPGKRFTLDGPKAFALFFLVVSRQTCPFGLEKMLNLGFSGDKDLFEYIKLIHSLQDSRNRAVHEGLTWEAKDEIESMRAQAFKIIEISLRVKKFLTSQDAGQSAASRLGMGA